MQMQMPPPGSFVEMESQETQQASSAAAAKIQQLGQQLWDRIKPVRPRPTGPKGLFPEAVPRVLFGILFKRFPRN